MREVRCQRSRVSDPEVRAAEVKGQTNSDDLMPSDVEG